VQARCSSRRRVRSRCSSRSGDGSRARHRRGNARGRGGGRGRRGGRGFGQRAFLPAGAGARLTAAGGGAGGFSGGWCAFRRSLARRAAAFDTLGRAHNGLTCPDLMAEHRVIDFGTKMKRARETRGVSLRQIATATKISVAALEALERNDISRLPGGIFSRAFVRSYAIEVGLDPENTVRDFLMQFPHASVTAGSPHVPQEDHEAIESARQSAQTALKLVAAAIPLAIIILYLTLAAPPERPAPDPAATRAESGATATSALGAAVATGEAAVPLSFEIVPTAPVTLEVTIDGTRRESRAFAAGGTPGF